MNWLRRFMSGRYGMDQLNLFLLCTALALEVVQIFAGGVFSLLAWIPLGWEIYRLFSRNIAARRAENAKFLQVTAGIRRWFTNIRRRAADAKTHRVFRCPSCGQQVRVPRNLGRLSITCPKCSTKFEKRT